MWGGELSGNSEQVKPRPISSLKPTEAIQVNNYAERDAILKLMEADGLKWNDGNDVFKYSFSDQYPFVLVLNFDGRHGIQHGSVEFHKHRGNTILPASDFLPTEFSVANEFKSMADKIDKQVADKLGYPTESSSVSTEPTEQQIDWTKPQPFPDDYVVPRGTKVVSLIEYFNVQIGEEGVCVDFDRTGSCRVYDFNSDGEVKSALYNHQVAPLDPTDHPLHPYFKGNYIAGTDPIPQPDKP